MTEAPKEKDLIGEILDRYGRQKGMLIPMMQDIQKEFGYLPRERLVELARRLGVPLSQVYHVATFYASFSLAPRGRHNITLCVGTVCYLKGAGQIADAIRKEFEVEPGGTSPDRMFTFSPVNCVGACALAPVMVVDDKYYGGMTVETAIKTLREIAAATPADKAAG
ncbi:MAG: NAD(P)H-dependent oxidoreductase subunit E [Planctomycetota bacterium]|nr:NAD(P)H-dependent oxidoreductase subunit E [Planctomycetota bacterium]